MSLPTIAYWKAERQDRTIIRYVLQAGHGARRAILNWLSESEGAFIMFPMLDAALAGGTVPIERIEQALAARGASDTFELEPQDFVEQVHCGTSALM